MHGIGDGTLMENQNQHGPMEPAHGNQNFDHQIHAQSFVQQNGTLMENQNRSGRTQPATANQTFDNQMHAQSFVQQNGTLMGNQNQFGRTQPAHGNQNFDNQMHAQSFVQQNGTLMENQNQHGQTEPAHGNQNFDNQMHAHTSVQQNGTLMENQQPRELSVFRSHQNSYHPFKRLSSSMANPEQHSQKHAITNKVPLKQLPLNNGDNSEKQLQTTQSHLSESITDMFSENENEPLSHSTPRNTSKENRCPKKTKHMEEADEQEKEGEEVVKRKLTKKVAGQVVRKSRRKIN